MHKGVPNKCPRTLISIFKLISNAAKNLLAVNNLKGYVHVYPQVGVANILCNRLALSTGPGL